MEHELRQRYTNWRTLFKEYGEKKKEAIDFVYVAAVEIVEYESLLTNSKGVKETEQQRDARMEDHTVYDKDYNKLLSHLKAFDDSLTSLTKVEVIFKVYNWINPVEITQSEVAQDDNVEAPTEPISASENLTTSSKASTVDTAEVEEPKPVSTEELSGNRDEEELQDNHKESNKVLPVDNTETQEKLNMGVGSSLPTDDRSTEHNDSIMSSMEVKTMAGLDALNTMAQHAQGATAATPQVGSEFNEAAVAAIQSTMAQRIAWTKANIVSKVVISAEPQVLRIPENSMGTLTVSGDAAKAVSKLMVKFREVTGYKVEDPDNKDFSKTVHPEDTEKAIKVLQLLQTMEANPTAEYPIFLPKPSFAIKGVQIGTNEPIHNDEFTDILMKNSIGYAVNAAGIVNGEAVKGAANGTTFELATTKKTVKAKKNGEISSNDAAQESVVYKRMVRVGGKSNMVDNAANVLIVYPTNRTVGKEGMKNVKVKAAIELNAGTAAASFRYVDGTEPVTKTDKKTGATTTVDVPKYKTFSVALNTLAYITDTEASGVFASMAPAKLQKFGNGVSLKSGTKEKEVVSTESSESINKYLAKSGLVKAISLAASGQFEDTANIADLVASVKAAGENAKAESDAKAAESVEDDMD